MTVSIDSEGMLIVPLYEILQQLNPDSAEDLIDTLACTDAVIDAVGKQILEGYTEMMSYAARSCPAVPDPHCAMDRLMRDLAKGYDDVAKKEIEDLENALRCERADNVKLRGQLVELSIGKYPTLHP